MKTRILILLLFITTITSAQKKFSINIGLGMGGTLGETSTVPDAGFPKGSPYIAGFISGYYMVNNNFSSGIEFLAASQLVSTGKGSKYISSTNTNIVSGNKLPASSILLRNRYKFLINKNVNPYLDLGFGITTFTYRSITADVRLVKKSNFAISPEIGLELSRFCFSLQAVFGGKTPTFEGFDTFSSQNISLRSTKSLQMYLTVSYKILQF